MGCRTPQEISIGNAEADCGEFLDGEETFAEIRKRSIERKRAMHRVLGSPRHCMAANRDRLPTRFIYLNDDRVEFGAAARSLHADRKAGEKTL